MDEEERSPIVGMTIGVTANLGNYQSLKVTLSAEIHTLPGESMEEAYNVLQEHILDQLYRRAPIVEHKIREAGIVS